MAKETIIQKNTYGLIFTLETSINLSQTDSLLLKMKKPGGSIIERTLVDTTLNITNPAKGTVTYIVQEDDLDEAGLYTIQIIETTDRYLPSVPQKFKVVESL